MTSWHIALMALLFVDLSPARRLDLLKVVTMVLIHDIVEIDCGDALVYVTALRLRAALVGSGQADGEGRKEKRVFPLATVQRASRERSCSSSTIFAHIGCTGEDSGAAVLPSAGYLMSPGPIFGSSLLTA
jgi:hypothetical protein